MDWLDHTQVEQLLGSSSSTTPAPQGHEHLGSIPNIGKKSFSAHVTACTISKQLHKHLTKNCLSQNQGQGA